MADFGELIREAAAAKAALDALSKSAKDANASQLANEEQLLAARKASIDSLKQEADQLRANQKALKKYNDSSVGEFREQATQIDSTTESVKTLHAESVEALKQEAAQVGLTADSYKSYNVQALYGGRSDMQSHLGHMERELAYETLLNRQRWLTFSSPQQAFAWRQNEYNQRLLMNRAEWAGYATADQ